MDYFPNRTPLTTVGQATSASLAALATYIGNFSQLSVNTASLALNISGAAGTNGSNYTKLGATGSQGAQGGVGYRGDSVYLLSASWSVGSPQTCHEIAGVGIAVATSTCDFSTPSTYYANASSVVNGTIMYYDSSCTLLAANLTDLAIGVTIFDTNGSGVAAATGDTCLDT